MALALAIIVVPDHRPGGIFVRGGGLRAILRYWARACAPWAGRKRRRQEKPAFKERLEQALDPLSRALPLSPSEVSRTRKWLIQAGYREPRHLTIYVGSRVLMALVGMSGRDRGQGQFRSACWMIGVGGFGFFIPRFMLKRMIRDRQRRITLGCRTRWTLP